ncbi:uncharacterized protein PAC_07509 [Phialocephala subalpina]|uniref:SAP domain-containing protein n=1 Tax=Phialocephala subalpina TaxID=576137 RepID=A0A1L7WXX3_9HELO|nr:uncharacterized protein PAC_07509 [Phialocephala subalpina]
MPRAKRVLAEADPNASNASRIPSTTTKSTKRKSTTQDTENVAPKAKKTRGKRSADENPTSQYVTKDNSKLRALLRDRGLPTDGTREELIKRLDESSPVDYDSLLVAELTEMCKQRNLKGAAQYSREIKVDRLKLNDSFDRDTGNGSDMTLLIQVAIKEQTLPELIANDAAATDSYAKKTTKQLCALLEKRKLSASGSKETLISRLRKHDQKERTKRIENYRKELARLKPKLESQIGHSPDYSKIIEGYERQERLDYEITSRQEYRTEPPNHICNYDWKDSHWAGRSERDLAEICTRREMPGHGPKAAMIKWLDTGVVDYEDLYASSLETICYKRGIKHKSGAKKVDLVRILKEADGAEGN